jgi:hypothetical protein
MFRVIDRSNTEEPVTWQDPQQQGDFEICEWEDILDDHGEPEPLGPGVWIIRAERDKQHHGVKAGDPIVLIIQIPR